MTATASRLEATTGHRTAVGRLISTPGRYAARFAVLVVSGYLSQMSETVLTRGDRMILGAQGLDARPLFLVAPSFDQTSAEMTTNEKNAGSHRAAAARAIAQHIAALARSFSAEA